MASKRISPDLADLEKQIGYNFKTRALLEQALTHVSAVKGPVTTDAYYERLEFLGDRVLGLAIAEILYRTFASEDEGVLSRRLATVVRKESCAKVAEAWGVSPFIRLGPGEMQSGYARRAFYLVMSVRRLSQRFISMVVMRPRALLLSEALAQSFMKAMRGGAMRNRVCRNGRWGGPCQSLSIVK